MSNMPCAEELTIALRGMGFAEQQVYTRQHADNALDQATNQMMQGTPPSVILQVKSTCRMLMQPTGSQQGATAVRVVSNISLS